MRKLVWIVALAGMIQTGPGAYAQSSSAPGTGAYDRGPDGSPIVSSAQPNPGNCGTPDEPKACPPMPRTPLQTYPGERPWKKG